MKNHRKLISMMLIISLLVVAFAGCGGKTAKSALTSEAEVSEVVQEEVVVEESTAEEVPAEEVVAEVSVEEEFIEEPALPVIELPLVEETAVLTCWATVNPQALSFINDLSENSVFMEAEKRTNVHVDFTCVSGGPAAEENFALMIAGGDYHDYIASMNLYTGGYDAAIEEEVIVAVNDVWEEYCPYYYDLVMNNENAYRALVTDGGKIPGFGMVQSGDFYPSQGMAIRQDFLDELGIEAPQTYDELYTALSRMKNELGVDSPLYANSMGLMQCNSMGAGYGIGFTYDAMLGYSGWYTEDGVVHSSYIEDAMKDYLLMVSQWYEEGLVWKDFASGGSVMTSMQSSASDAILGGDMALIYTESSDLDTLNEEGTAHWVGFAEPTLTPGETVHTIDTGLSSTSISWCISTACEDLELACRYLDYFYTDEGSFLADYGMEGEAHMIVDGEPVLTELITNNPDIAMRVALCIYTVDDTPRKTNGGRLLSAYSDWVTSAMDQWSSNIDGAGFYPSGAALTPDESSEYSVLMSDISTYLTETIPQFVNGSMDVETQWDSYVETLKSMGIEDCVAFKQAAYDRYLEK